MVIAPTITNPDPIVVPEYYIGQDLNIPHDPFTIDPNYYEITSYSLYIDPSLATVTYDSGTSSWTISETDISKVDTYTIGVIITLNDGTTMGSLNFVL